MTTPLDHHGGSMPPQFHTLRLPDTPNKVILFVNLDTKLNTAFIHTLLLNRVLAIVYKVSSQIKSTINLHPMCVFIKEDVNIHSVVKDILDTSGIDSIFFYECNDTVPIHPQFWSILETAQPGVNLHFTDTAGNEKTLFSYMNTGVASETRSVYPSVAAYTYSKSEYDQIVDSALRNIMLKTRCSVNEIAMDTSALFTPLCHLATKYMTDKSPYNLMTHRHPYTAVYDTFLRPFQRTQNLKLGEIGILNGSSTKMWREYFPIAKLCCFDIEMNYLKNVENMTGVEAYLVDAGQSSGLRNSLLEATHDGKKFDILLEDASHRLEHQLLFLRDALEYVAPGGLLIIEDIFRAIPAARFQEAIDSVSHMIQNVVLVRTEHVYRYSPDWENDRILFVWKA